MKLQKHDVTYMTFQETGYYKLMIGEHPDKINHKLWCNQLRIYER